MSEAKLLLDAAALADMHRMAAEIEALERRRGRPLSAGSPLLLAAQSGENEQAVRSKPNGAYGGNRTGRTAA